MATLDNAIAAGSEALSKLYDLQSLAMKAGDLTTQKSLGDDIKNLTYKLTQLRAEQIAGDDAELDALSKRLNSVTASAQSALDGTGQIIAVLNNVITAAKAVDVVLTAVAGI